MNQNTQNHRTENTSRDANTLPLAPSGDRCAKQTAIPHHLGHNCDNKTGFHAMSPDGRSARSGDCTAASSLGLRPCSSGHNAGRLANIVGSKSGQQHLRLALQILCGYEKQRQHVRPVALSTTRPVLTRRRVIIPCELGDEPARPVPAPIDPPSASCRGSDLMTKQHKRYAWSGHTEYRTPLIRHAGSIRAHVPTFASCASARMA